MAEQETKTAKFAGKKNRYRFNNRGNQTTKTNYKSKVTELEDEVLDVGALSDPAKFSKSLKSIENYIQKNYTTCYDIMKAIQQLLNAYQPPAGWNRHKQEAGARTDEGAMFAQTDNDNWKNEIECYKCGEKGHFAPECTKKKTKEAEQMHATIAEEEGQDLD